MYGCTNCNAVFVPRTSINEGLPLHSTDKAVWEWMNDTDWDSSLSVLADALTDWNRDG